MKQSSRFFLQFIFLILSFAFPLKSFSQGTWREMKGVGMNQLASDVPAEREEFALFSIGSNGFLGMGYVTTGVSPVRQYGDLNKYDPATMHWAKSVSWIPDRSRPFSFSISGKGYMGGGIDFYTANLFRDVWEYDDVTDSWTQKSDFPDSLRFHPFFFSVNGKGFIGGGMGSTFYNDFWEFDPLPNTWTRKPDVNFKRSGPSTFVIGTDAYVVAGDDSTYTFQHDVFKYDALIGQWSAVASYPGSFAPIGLNHGFAIAGNGYIVIGTTLYQYDPVNDTWNNKTGPPYYTYGLPVSISNYGFLLLSDGGVFRYDPFADNWAETNPSPSHYATCYRHYSENAITMMSRAYSGMSFYDPSIDAWTIDSSLSNTVWMFAIDDTGYAIHNNSFQKYNPFSGNWTILNPIPFTTAGLYFAAEGKGYSLFDLDSTFQFSPTLWEYDPQMDAWTQKADYPGGQNTTAMTFSIADKGYIVGGVNDSSWQLTNEFWEYDPAGDVWTAKADFPGWTFGQYLFTTEYKDAGYVGFGVDDPTGIQDGKLFRYDPSIDAWRLLPTPLSVRRRVTGFSLGDYLYIGMGAKRIDQTYSDTYYDLWRYSDSIVTAIDDLDNQDLISLFPNPVSTELSLGTTLPGKNVLVIYNIAGQRIFSAEVEKKITIDCSSFPSGIYFVRMKSKDGDQVKKLVVERTANKQ